MIYDSYIRFIFFQPQCLSRNLRSDDILPLFLFVCFQLSTNSKVCEWWSLIALIWLKLLSCKTAAGRTANPQRHWGQSTWVATAATCSTWRRINILHGYELVQWNVGKVWKWPKETFTWNRALKGNACNLAYPGINMLILEYIHFIFAIKLMLTLNQSWDIYIQWMLHLKQFDICFSMAHC